MTATIVAPTTVVSADVTALAMPVVVVIASDIGIISEVIRQQRLDRLVARPTDTAIELDASLGKRHLGAAAYAAADEDIRIDQFQKSGQCSVSLSVGMDHFRGYNFTIFYLIDFELLCVTEVLKDLSIFEGDCNFHVFILLIINYISQLPSQLENSI